ncbi:unnamed protein product [Sympodiomycopsis kandeliae]
MLRRTAVSTARTIAQAQRTARSCQASSSSSTSTSTLTSSASPARVRPLPPLCKVYSTTSPRLAVDTRQYTHFDPVPALGSSGKVPVAPYDSSPLPLTAPESLQGHLIVHPYTQPRPQETWPAAIESVSPFVNELNSRVKQLQQLQGEGDSSSGGWSVSFSDGNPRELKGKEMVYPAWDPTHPKVARPEPGDISEDEEFIIKVYKGNGIHTSIGPYSTKTLPSAQDLQNVILQAVSSARVPSARFPSKDESAHIYICTHGSRDCRCGVAGGELKSKVREEVRKHQLRIMDSNDPQASMKSVSVYGISHIGGHKYAANALVYPHGDWYGNLRETDASLILRSALAISTTRHDLNDTRERLVHWPRWRGRIGISHEQMQKTWDQWGGGVVQSAVLQPIVRRKPEQQSQLQPQGSSQPQPSSYNITFRKHTGELLSTTATLGTNLKDVAKSLSIEEIEATCGGKCECATCHAYLCNSSSSGQDLNSTIPEEILPPPTDEENDMLDYTVSRRQSSRLTCQVVLDEKLAQWLHSGQGIIQLSRY